MHRSRFFRRALAAVLVLASASPFASASDAQSNVVRAGAHRGEIPVRVTWKKLRFEADAPPAELPTAARDMLGAWSAWCSRNGYKIDFDDAVRVALVTPSGSSRSAAQMKLVTRTTTWFDGALPAPERKSATPAAAPKTPDAKKQGDNPLPEDPEMLRPPLDALEPVLAQDPIVPQHAWGSGTVEPDTQTATMIVLDNEKDWEALLDELASKSEHLAAQLKRDDTGVLTEDPLLGAYIENAAGQEEWSPEHELVHRIARLMLLRRFGPQPHWVASGVAWTAEMAYDSTVYCFPDRKEFVFAAEHGAWPSELSLLFKERATRPLELEEVASWRRGKFDGEAAKKSWGLMTHLIAQKGGKASAWLEELRVIRDRDNRRETAKYKWERIPDWVVPVEVQLATLQQAFDADVLKKASLSFRAKK